MRNDIFGMGRRELREIFISTLALGFAFSMVLGIDLLSSIFIIVLVFIMHELGHRTVARKFGAHAEYRMWPLGLLLSIASSFLGFVFAAPGAVYISPVVRKDFAFVVHRLSRREYGLIALSGPAINIALGFALLGASLLSGYGILLVAGYISFFLALFNLLPFPPLDGEKVAKWNWLAWGAAIALAALGYLAMGPILSSLA